jgi:hypothetical protein
VCAALRRAAASCMRRHQRLHLLLPLLLLAWRGANGKAAAAVVCRVECGAGGAGCRSACDADADAAAALPPHGACVRAPLLRLPTLLHRTRPTALWRAHACCRRCETAHA